MTWARKQGLSKRKHEYIKSIAKQIVSKKLSLEYIYNLNDQDAKDFLKYCIEEAKLNIIGLMVIPPNDENTDKYFQDILF